MANLVQDIWGTLILAAIKFSEPGSAKYRRSYWTYSNIKSKALTSLLAVAALCDFLYYLPGLADVSRPALIASHVLSVVAFIGVLAPLFSGKRVKTQQLLIAAWLGIVFVWLYGFAFANYLTYGGLAAVILMESSDQRKTLEKFIFLFSAILLINEIAYPLITVGWLPSLGEINPDNWLKQDVGMYYENFGVSYVLHGNLNAIQLGNFLLYRMSAWFEEPGNVGTIAALLLAATDFKMDWKGKVLLIGGIFSFSMAFFAIVFVYSLIKKPKIFFFMLLMLVSVAWYFQDTEFVSSKLIDRVSISDQGISGDNRTEVAFDSAYQAYVSTSNVWLGHDKDHQLYKLHYNSSSWKNLVWDYGIIGTALYISTFLFIFLHAVVKYSRGMRNGLKQFLPFVLVFILSIYQRPYVLILSFFTIYVGAMALRRSDQGLSHE